MPRIYTKRPPEDVASVFLSIRVTAAMNARLTAMATKAGVTKSQLTKNVLEQALAA